MWYVWGILITGSVLIALFAFLVGMDYQEWSNYSNHEEENILITLSAIALLSGAWVVTLVGLFSLGIGAATRRSKIWWSERHERKAARHKEKQKQRAAQKIPDL